MSEKLLQSRDQRAKERRRRKRMDRISAVLMPLLGILSVLVIWDGYCRIAKVPDWMLSKPLDVFAAIGENFNDFLPHLWRTFWVIGAGWIVACMVGIFLASIMVNYPLVNITLTPYINFLCVLPIVALLPMMYAIWGATLQIFFIAVVLQSFAINILNSATGFNNVPHLRTEMMVSLRANRLQTFFLCTFPSSLHSVFTGMKMSAIFATMTCVSAEMTGSTIGLGAYIQTAKTYGRTPEMLGSLLLIAVIGVFYYMLADMIEAAFIKWKE